MIAMEQPPQMPAAEPGNGKNPWKIHGPKLHIQRELRWSMEKRRLLHCQIRLDASCCMLLIFWIFGYSGYVQESV
jgi:hypothetical protein